MEYSEVDEDILSRQKNADNARRRYHLMSERERIFHSKTRAAKYYALKAIELELLMKPRKNLTIDELLDLKKILAKRKKRSDKALQRYHNLNQGILVVNFVIF